MKNVFKSIKKFPCKFEALNDDSNVSKNNEVKFAS